MPRKIIEPAAYPYPKWRAPLDTSPTTMRDAARLAAIPQTEFAGWLEGKSVVEQIMALRLRFRFDRMWFLRYCFPDVYSLPFNAYHVDTLTRPKKWWGHRKHTKEYLSVAAPRGVAKTTTAKGDILHDIVYALEGLIVIHSAGLSDGSEPFVRDLVTMAESSPRLAQLYGPVETWREGGLFQVFTIGDGPEVPVIPKSFKTQVRGTNRNAQRPTKYVIDDGEHPERVRNPDNRKADCQILQEDVAKCGPKEGGLIIDMRGTMLHPDSLLMWTTTHAAWRHQHWQAVLSWPTNTHLWDECKALWADLTDPDRDKTARAFYEANREAMDEGAAVLDPVAQPLYFLYEQLWAEGKTSFFKEYMNDVTSSGTSFFDMTQVSTFDVLSDANGRQYVLAGADKKKSYVDQMTLAMYLDPVPGADLGRLGEEGAGGSDYAAIAVAGKDKYGYLYVFEVWLKRARDDEQILAMFNLAEKYKIRKAGIESVGFSRLVTRDFNRMRAERREQDLYADVHVYDDNSATHIPKNERIAQLEMPMTMTHWVRFNSKLSPEAWKQFKEFPDGTHDDAPDAVAGVYRLLGGATPMAITNQTVRVR